VAAVLLADGSSRAMLASARLSCNLYDSSTGVGLIACVIVVDVMRAQYVSLSTKLNAGAVAVHMYQRNALTLKELQSVQCLRDRPVEAAETLLNVIMAQPDAVYMCFLDVLKHTDQQHVYQALVEGGYNGEYIVLINLYLTVLMHDTQAYKLEFRIA